MENEETNKKEKMLESLMNFFKTNIKMKDDVIDLCPTILDCCDEESLMKYTDKLYKSLKEFEIQFDEIANEFGFDDKIKEATKRYFERTKKAFELSKYEKWHVRRLYIHKFFEMTPKLIESTKKECSGYYMHRDIPSVIENAESINELLHIYHSYISNNEKILQSIPKIESKTNDIEEPITLYGEENEISRQIYDKFPSDLDCGITDIVSMKDKIITMVRDVGHALMIDIDTSQEKALVQYNIPKVCNRTMVELLPGINRKSITDNGAKGMFEVENDELADKLFDFISKVPRDGQFMLPQTNIEDLTKKWLEDVKKGDTTEVDYWTQKVLAIMKGQNNTKDKDEGVNLDD